MSKNQPADKTNALVAETFRIKREAIAAAKLRPEIAEAKLIRSLWLKATN